MGVSQRLLTCVDRGQMWVEMLTGSNVRVVDFANGATDTYDSSTLFEAELLCAIPKNISLVFLFQRGEHVLYTRSYGTTEALNKRANELLNLQYAPPGRKGETQLAICWLDHMYRFSGMRYGTKDKFYLLWASQISIYEGGDREVHKTGDMPVVVCTDGHFGLVAVYPLVHSADNHFIGKRRIRWVPPVDYPMFTCDTPLPPQPVVAQSGIAKLSTADAKERRERMLIPDHENNNLAGQTPEGSSSSVDVVAEDAVEEFFACALSETRVVGGIEERVAADVRDAEIARAMQMERGEEEEEDGMVDVPLEPLRPLIDVSDFDTSSGGEIVGPNDSPPGTVRFVHDPLSSPARRGRIPIGVLSRESHRTKNIGRIRLRTSASPRQQQQQQHHQSRRAISTSPVTQTSSDAEMLPMTEARPAPERPPNVSTLPLDKLSN